MNLSTAIQTLACDQTAVLIRDNRGVLCEALEDAEDGKVSFSLSCKLTLVGQRIYCATKLSTAKRYAAETESESLDLDQGRLPLGDIKQEKPHHD